MLKKVLNMKTQVLFILIETFSPKGVWKKAKEKCEKILVVAGVEPRATGFSDQYSNHWATTTLDFQDFHILPLYCWV